jgi:AcrR family transcriptional regulator
MKKIDETRETIIEAAGKLFQKFGFEKTSMDEIAQVAHKAKRSLYYHFQGKEELYKAVADKELKEIQSTLQDIFSDMSVTPIERLKNYLLKRMELMANATAYIQLLQEELLHDSIVRYPALSGIYTNFDKWEYSQFLFLWSEKPDAKCADLQPNAIAFANMLQMVLRSMDVSFFVQGKYEEYKKTYTLLINLILDSILHYILSDQPIK